MSAEVSRLVRQLRSDNARRELPLRVDLTRSPSRRGMAGMCAFRPAGVDVKRSSRIARTWLISTPEFHHWHHTHDEMRDHNYASMLPCWDWLSGTLHVPRNQSPLGYGSRTNCQIRWRSNCCIPLSPRRTPRPWRRSLAQVSLPR